MGGNAGCDKEQALEANTEANSTCQSSLPQWEFESKGCHCQLPQRWILVGCGHGIAVGAKEGEAKREVWNSGASCLQAGCFRS